MNISFVKTRLITAMTKLKGEACCDASRRKKYFSLGQQRDLYSLVSPISGENVIVQCKREIIVKSSSAFMFGGKMWVAVHLLSYY